MKLWWAAQDLFRNHAGKVWLVWIVGGVVILPIFLSLNGCGGDGSSSPEMCGAGPFKYECGD